MVEALVLGLCVGAYNCDQATKAYYAYNKNLQLVVRNGTKQAQATSNQLIGREATTLLPLAAGLAAHRPYQVKISRAFSCGKASQGASCIYEWTF